MKKGNKHIGPSFDEFLAEEGILNEVHACNGPKAGVGLAGQARHGGETPVEVGAG